jgi:hypothetical protein
LSSIGAPPLTGVIVRRDRLLEPCDDVGFKLFGELDRDGNLKRVVRVDHQPAASARKVAGLPGHRGGYTGDGQFDEFGFDR